MRGEGFPRLGMLPRPLASVLPTANRLPRRTKRWLYRRSGASEAISPESLGDVDIEAFREWVTDQYPSRGYPAVLVGSPNGALVHLAALLGVPWLPQTFLIPVRRSLAPDAATADMEWGEEPGRALLSENSDVRLHHMHDPNQDRLTVEELAYFRFKIRRLGAAYRRFLRKTLAPGGTVILFECSHHWPTTRVGDRHVFQFGGLGGLGPEEYFEGSDRVASFLSGEGTTRERWDPPEPDERAPEAEWGFEPALREDVVDVTDRLELRLHRLAVEDPRELSGLVADLYRQQYAGRGLDTGRLFVENFTLVEPWWAFRTGSVPFWLPFNANAAVESLNAYLDDADDYEEIYLTLFSNGVEAAGQASIEQWRGVVDRAGTRGAFVGVDPSAYPLDFGVYARYHSALPETIPSRRPMLPPLPPAEFEASMEDLVRRHPVGWTEHYGQ